MPKRYLITGGAGSVGSALLHKLWARGAGVSSYDWAHSFSDFHASNDILDTELLGETVRRMRPDAIYHLAAAKHAPAGEEHPGECHSVNIVGTENVIDAALGTKVILASTCKAADAETVYGATKLIAERLVLNAGGVVIRFYNIFASSGNVFEIWRSLDTEQPIPVCDCIRYFMTMEQAIGLLIAAQDYPSGRYVVHPGPAVRMVDLAATLYPDRTLEHIPPRRGDRIAEPLHGKCETMTHYRDEPFGAVYRIEGQHDPVVEHVAAARSEA